MLVSHAIVLEAVEQGMREESIALLAVLGFPDGIGLSISRPAPIFCQNRHAGIIESAHDDVHSPRVASVEDEELGEGLDLFGNLDKLVRADQVSVAYISVIIMRQHVILINAYGKNIEMGLSVACSTKKDYKKYFENFWQRSS